MRDKHTYVCSERKTITPMSASSASQKELVFDSFGDHTGPMDSHADRRFGFIFSRPQGCENS